ncbi:MAG TPA: hypothetical protein VGG32_05505 [Thermoplasmata archaeon]|jgi:hypothetical protein
MPPRQGRPLSRIVRTFIEERLLRGDSQKTVRETVNALRTNPPSYFVGENWTRWDGIRGKRNATTADVYRVYDALRKSQSKTAAYAERKRLRETWKTETAAERDLARDLGIPEPTRNKQLAHDAGVLYKATKDERYREFFEEGSRL